MAKTISELKAQSAEVKNASAIGENTATRVGQLFGDIVEHVEQFESAQGMKDAQQDTTALSLVSQEATRAQGVEDTLRNSINAEIENRESGDNTLAARINTELSQRKDADDNIRTALNNEIARATVAEQELASAQIYTAKIQDGAVTTPKIADGAVTHEKTDIIAQELGTNVTKVPSQKVVTDAISNEETERKADVDKLTASIEAETEARDIAINSEAQARSQNDALLNQAIVAEKNRAEAKEMEMTEAIQRVIYDVSAQNNGAVFESLSDLLNQDNLSTLIPASVRCGGMSIRFIQESVLNSDNKYVQYRLMSDTFSTTESDWQGVDDEPTAGSENLVKSGGVSNAVVLLESLITNIERIIQDKNNDTLYIVDANGYVVAKVNANGIKSIEFIDKNNHTLTELLAGKADVEDLEGINSAIENINQHFQSLESEACYIADNKGNYIAKFDATGLEVIDVKANGRKLSIGPLDWYDKFYITDAKGNIVMQVDENGLRVIDVSFFGMPVNDWKGKGLATYGDSVTAVNKGDFLIPYDLSGTYNWNWGNVVANYFKMAHQYGRGIGGQGYKWGTAAGNGGSVDWVSPTGVDLGRLDQYNYDNWDGTTYPSGVTAEMEQQGQAIRIRGCLASWLRITKMFPVSIKDNIDVVLVMAHNDSYDTNDCVFIANDTTDPEWAASGSDYYGKIGGDYNITTFKGAVASTIMKLQLWMPNAIIILMTGISGQGITGELNLDINGSSGLNKAESIRDMSKLTSVPCIDTYARDGINGWNRTTYIVDSIHPYTVAGRNMFARAVIGGLKTILPPTLNINL